MSSTTGKRARRRRPERERQRRERFLAERRREAELLARLRAELGADEHGRVTAVVIKVAV